MLAVAALSLLPAGCSGGGFKMPGRSSAPAYHPLKEDLAAMQAAKKGGDLRTLTCVTGKGQAMFGRNWKPFSQVSFTLAEGARTNLSLSSSSGGDRSNLQGIFDRDGQKIIFCPIVGGPATQQISCASLYALDDDLDMGIRRTFDVPAAVMGAEISCAYNPARLQKL